MHLLLNEQNFDIKNNLFFKLDHSLAVIPVPLRIKQRENVSHFIKFFMINLSQVGDISSVNCTNNVTDIHT